MIKKTFYKTKDYCKVKFVCNYNDAETIELLGLNNDWVNPIILAKKKDGSFSADVSLPKNSTHQFKYKVNANIWLNESEADAEQPNEFGGTNSVIIL